MNGIEQIQSLFSGNSTYLCGDGCGIATADPLDVGAVLVDDVRAYYYATLQCVREAGHERAIPYLETLERCGEPLVAALNEQVLSRATREKWYQALGWTTERARERRAERAHPANWSDDEWQAFFNEHQRLRDELGEELFEELVSEHSRSF